MERIFSTIAAMFQNSFITIWFWINTYRWQLLLLLLLGVVVYLEIREAKVHFVNDERKVV